MREILFRAKRLDDRQWVEGCLDYSPVTKLCFIRVPHHIYTDVHLVDHATVGQYTGMSDKNGKRIFEGDCLGHPLNVVEYLNDGFCVNGDRPLDMMAKFCAIVGNIHDKGTEGGGAER